MKINILLIISFLSISSLCITAQNIENRLFSFSENNKRYYVNIEGERVTDAIYDNNYSASIENCDKGRLRYCYHLRRIPEYEHLEGVCQPSAPHDPDQYLFHPDRRAHRPGSGYSGRP